MTAFRCPGCGKDMTDYMAHEAHYAEAEDQRPPNGFDNWPWTDTRGASSRNNTLCPWTRDYLSAELLRQHPQPWSY